MGGLGLAKRDTVTAPRSPWCLYLSWYLYLYLSLSLYLVANHTKHRLELRLNLSRHFTVIAAALPHGGMWMWMPGGGAEATLEYRVEKSQPQI